MSIKTSLIAISFIIIFLNSNNSYSQGYTTQRNQIFAYNILFNGLIGGIGGVVNKKEGEKNLKIFGKNFLKGSLGGLIKYTAKYETYYLSQQALSGFAKPNRLLFYLGQSFVNNASLNQSLLYSYNAQFYGIHMEFKFEDKFSFKSRISILTYFDLITTIAEGNRLDLDRSLEYGVFYFDMNPKFDSIQRGGARHNIIIIGHPSNSTPLFSVIPHEILHTYQFFDYFTISNTFYPKSFKKIKSNKTYDFLSKYFYLEVSYFSLFYYFQPRPAHYKNFFEFEAQHFSSRRYINR